MLGASLALIVCTAGVSLLAAVWRVRAVGRRAATAGAGDTAVVPGKSPYRGAIDGDHRVRLARARALLGSGRVERIVLLGGATGGAAVSEAELARRHLLAAGIEDGRLVVEESSQHTLENLQQLRHLLPALGAARLVLVSNRYHLARCAAMASELRLPLELSAAEPRWRTDGRTVLRVAGEAFLLHWYAVGRVLARALHYRRALARIS